MKKQNDENKISQMQTANPVIIRNYNYKNKLNKKKNANPCPAQ